MDIQISPWVQRYENRERVVLFSHGDPGNERRFATHIEIERPDGTRARFSGNYDMQLREALDDYGSRQASIMRAAKGRVAN